jgi:hypothetical protein
MKNLFILATLCSTAFCMEVDTSAATSSARAVKIELTAAEIYDCAALFQKEPTAETSLHTVLKQSMYNPREAVRSALLVFGSRGDVLDDGNVAGIIEAFGKFWNNQYQVAEILAQYTSFQTLNLYTVQNIIESLGMIHPEMRQEIALLTRDALAACNLGVESCGFTAQSLVSTISTATNPAETVKLSCELAKKIKEVSTVGVNDITLAIQCIGSVCTDHRDSVVQDAISRIVPGMKFFQIEEVIKNIK